jgi:puromycin-sensitive aminopeptidase
MTQQNAGCAYAVVLGSGVDAHGVPSQATVLRAQAGVELAKARPELTVILSGGSPPYVNDPALSEASVMARLFLEQGIPRERLLLEEESRDTIGNAVLSAARYLYPTTHPCALYVVTSPFHMERSLASFRGVLGPQWDIHPVESGVADDDTTRGANERGGIEWTRQFYNGITPGDVPAVVSRLLEVRGERYGHLAWLRKVGVNPMCMACMDNNGSVLAVAAGSARLPETIVPEHYQLTLSPDLKAFTFDGEEVIDIRVKAPVEHIVLNAVDLDITDAYIVDSCGTRMNATVKLDAANEHAVFDFHGTVGKGKWKLHLRFAGKLTTKLSGFYRSTYKQNGVEKVIASTQFEPNDARRAFPCFDEPMFKATFGVTLIVDEHLTAISNGPIVKETLVPIPGSGCTVAAGGFAMPTLPTKHKRVVEFGTTMKMSTYLVAFVVGEFEATDPIVVNGTDVRVFCLPGKKRLATFALKAAQFSLTWFEKYFGIKYPGDKLDLIGIPDFAFGAMENLGCVTFRETALLVDEGTGTIAELSRVAEVVAHEIAHMWFGDLVTMEWWNALWLNEAFATFMATKVQHDFRREWDRWTNFGVERAAALRTDGLGATRPMEAPVINPASALGMIDVITYRKGCSVLRQLEQFIGEDTFRNGIRAYLRKHSYANAKASDLWDAIQSVTSHPVKDIMESWVLQPGYPVVNVTEGTIGGTITLSQKPFKYLAESVDESQRWLVPVYLRYKTKDGEGSQWVLLDEGDQTIYLGEDLEWVVANANGYGFYRTLYSPALAAKLTANLQGNLSAIERFNLVNDAWACVLAGLSSGSDYLDVAQLFSGETDPNVWSVLDSSLSRLSGMLPERNRAEFAKLVRKLATPQYERLGWDVKDTDTAQDRQVRGIVIDLLGTLGHSTKVTDKAKELFAEYKTDRKAVASDVAPAVINLVAYSGGAAEYDELFKLMEATDVPQEKVRFLYALAGFRDEKLLERTLNATITATVRTQDAPALLVRLLGNRRINRKAWEFIKNNWAHMVGNYPETGMISLTSGVTALDVAELEADVREFFAANAVKGGDKAIAQNLESLRINVLLREREAGPLANQFAMPVVTPPAADSNTTKA